MNQLYTNTLNISLPLAVFLATDDYDYVPNTISATTLLKPIRQWVLTKRVSPTDALRDVSSLVSSRMGSALHTALEHAWDEPTNALKALGYPDKVIERIRINPKPEELKPDTIPIYKEQRSFKKLGKHTISGKFDFVAEGQVHDYKSTSVYSYLNQTNEDKWSLQGSIYRWLNPEIITRDTLAIHFIFTDWSKASASKDPKYPQSRVHSKILKLLSLEETEAYIQAKLKEYEKFLKADEDKIPFCTDEELWRKPATYKYYRDPSKTQRSTKNFETSAEAYKRFHEDGATGLVKEVKGGVSACKYCSAFTVCSQKDAYIHSGELTLD